MVNYQRPLVIWDMDNSYGCTTLWLYLMPLNGTLKNSYNGKFFIIFYYNLKNPTANIILNIELLEAIPLN